MARSEDRLKVVAPEPVDEQTPLLGNADGDSSAVNNTLEAQAEQEIREHDVGHVPLAEEPSTKKLVLTMSSLWLVSCMYLAVLIQEHR